MEQGRKLRAMYRLLGYSRTDCAKFLQVSERSLHNWESGRYRMPLAVFKLLRLQLGYVAARQGLGRLVHLARQAVHA